jgi:serine protease Do
MKRSMAIVLALVFGLGIGVGVSSLGSSLAATSPAVTLAQAPAPLAGSTFAKLADAVKPAVINVATQSKTGGRTAPEEHFGEDLFRRFFGDAPDRLPRRSLGSGVIIDPSGIALTNAHVIDNASQIEVMTLDGSKYGAKVLGVDKKTDLAVLRIGNGKADFPALRLGDSNETRVGDWVVAIGSPFGLQATVTAGIISAKARHIGAGPYDDFLQTDAAINPGNSGGPLVNLRGEIVGINTAVVRGGSGIGFAIPSSLVKRVSAELTAKGKVTRGWLGVSLQPLTSELAASFGARDRKGALVAEVVSDSPAAAAGVKSGDIILQVNGEKVDDPGDLARAVAAAAPGQTAKVKVWRDGQERALDIRLTEQPGERQAATLGLTVRPVTAEVARELELPSTEGVLVDSVASGSAAEKAGIRRGDVIREIDRKPVKTTADFDRLARATRREHPTTVKLQRGPTSLYVAIPPTTG